MPDRAASRNGAAPPRAAFGIGRKLALAALAVVLLFAALAALVSSQVGRMHTSFLRVLEEQRESAHTQELVHALRALEHRASTAALRAGSVEAERQVRLDLIADARGALAALERGPEGRDPAEPEHASEETRIYARLEGGFDALEAAQRAGPGAPAGEVAPVVALAEELHASDVAAAERSRATFSESVREMRLEILGATLAALALLGAIAWILQRTIVRPLGELRTGAVRIAGGDLSHRVAVASRDELGELAWDFNEMAHELAAMRSGLEARVEERTREFVRAARLAGLGTMAAGVAHEINNPLASIASCAEGLERKLDAGGASRELQKEYLGIIAREAYRAHEITSKLLDFARTDRGSHVRFAVPGLMREIAVLLEHRLRARGVRLETSCEEGTPEVEGDPSECKQVLLNLVHNAIDASPPEGVVRVSCRGERGELVLEVEDQGPGIPPGDIDRIFDPFFTTKPPGKGTGLGLAIVHRIVESHGGRIEVENASTGARFRVRMPAAGRVVA